MINSDTSVKVAVRIRPLNSQELAEDSTHCIDVNPVAAQVIAGSDSVFTFDHVFGVDSAQSDIYDQCVLDLVNSAFEGFNATILAYGQTGSGKTFTMGSSHDIRYFTAESMGIIPRVIKTLFDTVQTREAEDINSTYKIQVQFLEIYGDDIKDLLDHTKTSKVTIRETVNGDVFISGAREEAVSSAAQMLRALEDGTKHRTTASTKMNQSSSRSHAIFTVILEHTIHIGTVGDAKRDNLEEVAEHNIVASEEDSEYTNKELRLEEQSDPRHLHSVRQSKAEVRRSKFHFVDLAGSERAKRTGAAGQQLKEGIDINKGLLALGNVISALGDEQKKGRVHVPYRDSKVTRILQDSLGGNSKTLFICCVSPAGANFHESINALRYANRARNIKNKPVVNRDPTLVMIDELKAVVRTLAEDLLSVQRACVTLPAELSLAYSTEQLEGMVAMGAAVAGGGGGNAAVTATAAASARLGQSAKRSADLNPYASSVVAAGTRPALGSAVGKTLPAGVGGISATVGSGSGAGVSGLQKEIQAVKLRLGDADAEVRRLSERLKRARHEASELSERAILLESETAFYRMKWAEACPEDAKHLSSLGADPTPLGNSRGSTSPARAASEGATSGAEEDTTTGTSSGTGDGVTSNDGGSGGGEEDPALAEKKQIVSVVAGYLREIDGLRHKVAELQQHRGGSAGGAGGAGTGKRRGGGSKGNYSPGGLDFTSSGGGGGGGDSVDFDEVILGADVESELTSSVARVIAQTKEHLRQESQRLLLKGVIAEDTVVSMFGTLTDETAAELDPEGEGGDGEGGEGSEASNGKVERAGKKADEEEKEFHLRQRRIATEVQDLGESIALKEQLMQQLQRSQYQYSVMKAFYEQKLQALEEEMEAKQEERERLEIELQDVVNSQNEVVATKRDRELNLRDELRRKDDELKALKKRQEELSNLSQVQARYMRQLSKLETDIEGMKKQRVDLTRTLQAEKKKHMISINERAKEIEKLKRELAKAAGEVKRLGKDKERAEDRAREAMREGSMLRKRANDLLKFGVADPAAASARTARRALNTANGAKRNSTSVSHSMSEEQLTTKRWLDKRIADINAREREAEALRKQCEQQLALLNQRDVLETQKLALEHLDTSTPLAAVLAATASVGDAATVEVGEDEVIQELSGRIESIDQQALLREQKIVQMQEQLAALDEEVTNDEKTIEILKKTAAGSLPAAHELVRLLFDMLVRSRRVNGAQQDALALVQQREQQARSDLENAYARSAAAEREHDKELTRVRFEFEEKLQGLFDHSSVGQVVLAESGFGAAGTRGHNPALARLSFGDGGSGSANAVGGLMGRSPAKVDTVESYKMLLAVSSEQQSVLKQQLSKEQNQVRDLQSRVDDLQQERQQAAREQDELRCHIEFLEAERSLFREMADDLKAGIANMGGIIGHSIIRQVREKAFDKGSGLLGKARENFLAALEIDEDEEGDGSGDFDDDHSMIMREFSQLNDEITRTGGVAAGAGAGAGAGATAAAAGTSKPVYERLADPSNFTGSTKTMFKQEVPKKREKVERIKVGNSKAHAQPTAKKEPTASAAPARRRELFEAKLSAFADHRPGEPQRLELYRPDSISNGDNGQGGNGKEKLRLDLRSMLESKDGDDDENCDSVTSQSDGAREGLGLGLDAGEDEESVGSAPGSSISSPQESIEMYARLSQHCIGAHRSKQSASPAEEFEDDDDGEGQDVLGAMPDMSRPQSMSDGLAAGAASGASAGVLLGGDSDYDSRYRYSIDDPAAMAPIMEPKQPSATERLYHSTTKSARLKQNPQQPFTPGLIVPAPAGGSFSTLPPRAPTKLQPGLFGTDQPSSQRSVQVATVSQQLRRVTNDVLQPHQLLPTALPPPPPLSGAQSSGATAAASTAGAASRPHVFVSKLLDAQQQAASRPLRERAEHRGKAADSSSTSTATAAAQGSQQPSKKRQSLQPAVQS